MYRHALLFYRNPMLGLLILMLGISCPALGDSGKDMEPLGPEPSPEEDIRTVLLRDASVVLRQGAWDIEAGLDYTRRDNDFSATGNDLTRRLLVPLTLRVGLLRRLEGFLSVPFIYSDRELTDDDLRLTDSDSGLGDLVGGLSFQVVPEKPGRPEIVGSLQARAPTGADPYRDDGARAPLGAGHWAFAAGIQFVRTSDPVVIYWGADYVHQLEEDGLGRSFQPGGRLDYSMGVGFAVNQDMTLSGLFSGAYQGRLEVDDEALRGSSSEPMRLRFAVTQRSRRNVYVESYVSFGLNEDAPETVAGASVITRLGRGR